MTLKQKPIYTELISCILELFDPKSSQMRLFMERIEDNTHMCKLFYRIPRVECDGPKKYHGGNTKIIEECEMCTAITYAVIKNEDGDLVPKRCSRSKKDDGYCTMHGSKRFEEKCSICSIREKCTVNHEFKWQHLGTISEPTVVFVTDHDDLVRTYNKKQGNYVPPKSRMKKINQSKENESDEEVPITEDETEDETQSYNYNEQYNVFTDSNNIVYTNQGTKDDPLVDDNDAVGQFKSDGSIKFFANKK